MKEMNLKALKKRPYRPKTTQSFTSQEPVINRLNQAHITEPNQCLVTDITYIATKEGWLYLAGFMDIYSKMIKGYSIHERMPTELITSALKKALHRFPKLQGAIVHSDRGSQYTSNQYKAMLEQHGLKISMGETGCCYDNAAIESFWSTLKTECFPVSGVFETKSEAKNAIFEYIEAYYNTQRLHSSLNYTVPLDVERAA